MGITMAVVAYPDIEVPFWFTQSDSKSLLSQLHELRDNHPEAEVVRLLKHFNLSLAPLLKFADRDEESLASWMEREPTPEHAMNWVKNHTNNAAAWQPPEVYLEALEEVVTALTQSPGVFDELEISERYFTEGIFESDLCDLEVMFEWVQDNGYFLARLEIG